MANPFEVLDSSLNDLENVLADDDTADDIFGFIDMAAALIPSVAGLRDELLALINALIAGIEDLDLTLEGLLQNAGLSEGQANDVSSALTSVSQIADASGEIAGQIGGSAGSGITNALNDIQDLADALETLPTEELKASILQTLGVLAARLQ